MPATNIVPQLELIEGLAPTGRGSRGSSTSVRTRAVWWSIRGCRARRPILFNEKVMAGLGRGIAVDGRLTKGSIAVALTRARPVAMLAHDMGLSSLRTVATAAVREAINADAFVDAVLHHTGLTIEVIDGETEARAAALGVIAGIPEADGVVGDLGGGSLELIRVAGGEAHERISLPIGSLRLDAVRKRGPRALGPFIRSALDQVGWASMGRGRPVLHGRWLVARAGAAPHSPDRLSAAGDSPVPHGRAGARTARAHACGGPGQSLCRDIPVLSSTRIPSLPGAAALLGATVRRLGSSHIVASAYGLREVLLFFATVARAAARGPVDRRRTPRGRAPGALPEHGDVLMNWMDGLFDARDAASPRATAACAMREPA